MPTDYVQNGLVCFQQKTTGAFDGTMVGYASRAYTAGGGAGRFRATALGAATATPTIELVDKGAGQIVTATTVQNQGGRVKVVLRRNAGAILADANEIAAALSAYRDANGNGSPILLGVTTNATSAAVAEVAMTGGLTPTYANATLRFDLTAAAGGLVFFDARRAVEVPQMEILAGAGTAKIEIVNVDDGLNPVAGESVDVTAAFTGTTNVLYAGKAPLVVGPRQALRVTGVTASTNLIRAWARLTSVGY